MGNSKASTEYLPSTTLASGNVAPAASTSDSPWGAGVDSSTGSASSSYATTVEGSSPSQDRSVNFLQKYTIGCQSKLNYYTKYYSGRISTSVGSKYYTKYYTKYYYQVHQVLLRKDTNYYTKYYTKYYSGRISTIVTVRAPRMLAISTRPASVDASCCASVVVASPPAAVADVVLSCAPSATTSSAAAAVGSVLS
jgi:hypothetical protein